MKEGNDGEEEDSSYVKRPRRNTIDSGSIACPIDTIKSGKSTFTPFAFSLDAFSSNVYFPTYAAQHGVPEYCEMDASLHHNYAVSWGRRPSVESIEFQGSSRDDDEIEVTELLVDPLSS